MAYDNYSVRLLRSAQEDLADLVNQAMADSPSTATKFLALIIEELTAVADQPGVSASPSESGLAQAGYRYIVVQDNMIFFVVEAETVLVHRIVSGASQYKGLLPLK